MKTKRLSWTWFSAVAGAMALACGPVEEAPSRGEVGTAQSAVTTCGDGICNGTETRCTCSTDCVDEATLVNTYAPIFKLDGAETNLPSSVEWYFARTTLRFNHDGGCPDEQVLAPYAVTATNLLGQTRKTHGGLPFCSSESTVINSSVKNPSDEFFFLQIPNDGNEGTTRLGDTSGASWRTYAHVRRDGAEGWEIQYWNFYPYNGLTPGEHEGDWEHVTVHLAADGVTPTSVYFAEHDGGTAYAWSAVEKSGNRVIVYVADGSHASYPHAGTTDRSPLPNDVHNGNGKVFDALNKVVHVGDRACNFNGRTWMTYGGLWGEVGEVFSGPPSPVYQSSWSTLGH